MLLFIEVSDYKIILKKNIENIEFEFLKQVIKLIFCTIVTIRQTTLLPKIHVDVISHHLGNSVLVGTGVSEVVGLLQ